MMDVWGLALLHELAVSLVGFVIPFFSGVVAGYLTTRVSFAAGYKAARRDRLLQKNLSPP